jgi:hypothetical protein
LKLKDYSGTLFLPKLVNSKLDKFVERRYVKHGKRNMAKETWQKKHGKRNM